MERIPITRPFFGDEELEALKTVLESGWVSQGPKTQEFEEAFSSCVMARHAVATSSCTTALHLALTALGAGEGDKVVIPSFTFVATANAVRHAGAEPVFCDIDLDTYNIDTDHLESLCARLATDGSLKVVMPVHLFGLPADMDKIMNIAGHYGLAVVEDAACGVGSRYKGKSVGTFGDVGCFSFHPRKIITTGEGGMAVTDDEEIERKLRALRSHGESRSDLQRHTQKGGSLLPEYDVLGYNYRMTDIQAAVGVSQLIRLDSVLEARRKAARFYNAMIDLDWVRKPAALEGYDHSYQSYVIMIDKNYFDGDVLKANVFRNNLIERMEELGVSTRQGTHAVHTLGYYKNKYGLKDMDYPKSYEADRLSVALPLYTEITEEAQNYVIETMAKAAAGL